MRATNPLVTVVVTTYNHSPYISACLTSVFAQTYHRYEVVVVDDGSTDDTPSKISGFGDKLRYLRQTNQGVASARNAGILNAKGDLLAFLDGDDIWEPTKLAAQVAAALHHPESGLIATDGIQFDDDGVLSRTLIGPTIRGLLATSDCVTVRCFSQLLQGNFISTTSQVMIPKHIFETVGLSDPSLPIGSDWDLYLRIARASPVTILKERLVRWRYLPTSVSGPRGLRRLRWAPDEIEILKRLLRHGSSEHRPLVENLLRRKISEAAETAYYYGRAADKHWAQRFLLRLVAANPRSLAAAMYFIAISLPRPLTRITAYTARRVLRWPLSRPPG